MEMPKMEPKLFGFVPSYACVKLPIQTKNPPSQN
jgi:hypothetical protein